MYEAGEMRNENGLEEALKMCYLIAQNKNVHGCIALKTRHGSHLVEMKRRMNQQVASKGIQIVTISRPTAYGEYAPYTFIENEEEFEKLVEKMK